VHWHICLFYLICWSNSPPLEGRRCCRGSVLEHAKKKKKKKKKEKNGRKKKEKNSPYICSPPSPAPNANRPNATINTHARSAGGRFRAAPPSALALTRALWTASPALARASAPAASALKVSAVASSAFKASAPAASAVKASAVAASAGSSAGAKAAADPGGDVVPASIVIRLPGSAPVTVPLPADAAARLASGIQTTTEMRRQQLAETEAALAPLLAKQHEISRAADRYTTRMLSLGLGVWFTQFLILARLTWFEYSWDVLEPVTYFLGMWNALCWSVVYLYVRRENSMSDLGTWLHARKENALIQREGLDTAKIEKLLARERQLRIDLGLDLSHLHEQH
jgi:hypothetical protein